MARPKPYKASATMAHHCAMCDRSFQTRMELQNHVANHPDSGRTPLYCAVCNWPFEDSHALEVHERQSSHGTPQFACENCSKAFVSQRVLEEHLKPPYGCSKASTTPAAIQPPKGPPPTGPSTTATAITCDRCLDTFNTKRAYKDHRSFPNGTCADFKHKRTPPKKQSQPPRTGYVDLDRPPQTGNDILGYEDRPDSPDNMEKGQEWCSKCKRIFESRGAFARHSLGCSAVDQGSRSNVPVARSLEAASTAAKPSKAFQSPVSTRQGSHVLSVQAPDPRGPRSLAEASRPMQNVNLNTRPPVPQQRPGPPTPTPTTPNSGLATFTCSANGCSKTFRSEAGLKTHQGDAHGIGGQRLDLNGRDSWMLGQRERERLRAEGLLRPPPGSPRGRGGRQTLPASVARQSPPIARPLPMSTSRPSPMPAARPIHTLSPLRHHAPQHAPVHRTPMSAPGPMPTSQNMGGPAEMEQAKFIQGKILRLLIQSDIFIHHDGKMNVCGIDWIRIGVSKQHEVVNMFDGMCHLPKIIQTEYIPPPKTFKNEYTAQYPVANFEQSPDRDRSKPGLGIVALSCSKIVLADGRQEVVKVAAVDLVTCRILMNHLVCTDPHAEVANWRSAVTGLFGWRDMEGARQAGYKVFKGWSAARSALWKFVDKETIIVGHNLRSDLDALRMIHGRAVDVAKVVEKAAKGPLSKVQLSLDSLCRDYAGAQLKSDPEYGRDSLMNAFAARQFALWVCKNQEKLDKDAKQKSLDYQKIMPKAVAV